MPLSEIRSRFIDTCGRKDFETNTPAADRFINAGMRLLDTMQRTPKSTLRFQKDIAAGDITLNLKYCRIIHEVWVMDSDGRTRLGKRTLDWIRQKYAEVSTEIDQDTPTYYAPAIIGLSPEHISGTNIVGNGGFDSAVDWAAANGWSIADGKATHTPEVTMALWQDTGVDNTADKTYWVTFTVRDYTAGTITPYIQANAGTARSANGTYTEQIVHDGDTDPDLIIKFVPSIDFDGAIDDVAVYSLGQLDFTYDWEDIRFGDHWGHRGIIFMPPSDGVYTMSVWADFFSKPLSAATDENWWTEEFPELLVHAACYQLETHYRNTEGARDWMNAIRLQLQGIYYDQIEEQLAEIQNQVRGYT